MFTHYKTWTLMFFSLCLSLSSPLTRSNSSAASSAIRRCITVGGLKLPAATSTTGVRGCVEAALQLSLSVGRGGLRGSGAGAGRRPGPRYVPEEGTDAWLGVAGPVRRKEGEEHAG